ncbi:hypothetical protein RN001_003416 [Aquatica leii]|uniref:Uncharacterized protein n=1 Tax=Aquatica leii TaxID=1421715 RepID=A0AAN7ST09_9COLE|nr:hypothetical protein RN001_003416 [Aquatica leii]
MENFKRNFVELEDTTLYTVWTKVKNMVNQDVTVSEIYDEVEENAQTDVFQNIGENNPQINVEVENVAQIDTPTFQNIEEINPQINAEMEKGLPIAPNKDNEAGNNLDAQQQTPTKNIDVAAEELKDEHSDSNNEMIETKYTKKGALRQRKKYKYSVDDNTVICCERSLNEILNGDKDRAFCDIETDNVLKINALLINLLTSIEQIIKLQTELLQSKDNHIKDLNKKINSLEDRKTNATLSPYVETHKVNANKQQKVPKLYSEVSKHQSQPKKGQVNTNARNAQIQEQVVISPTPEEIDSKNCLQTIINLNSDDNTNSVHKSNKDDDDFKLVNYQKPQKKLVNTYKTKPIIGTNSSNTFSITAAPKKAWAFIGRISPSVTEINMLDHLKMITNDEEVECLKLHSKGQNLCFRVATNIKHADTLLDPNNWPEHVRVSRYNFRFAEHKGCND